MDIQKTHMNKNISFLRIRPCDNNNEIYLNSRRKEGTSAFLIKSELDLDIMEIHKKDFQTLSNDASVDSDCWIINDNNWKNFKDINPKRIVYDFKNNKETSLEVIDRLKPYTVLVSNSLDIEFLKAINTKTKFITTAYVDTIDEALDYIKKGITDLLLRDWSSAQIHELQNIEGFNFYERTLLSPVFSIDEARNEFTKERFFRYLSTRNVRGFRREKTEWFPGSGKDIPQLNNFVYNNKSQIKHFEIDEILNNVLNGYQINDCLLYTSPSPRDLSTSRMPSSA